MMKWKIDSLEQYSRINLIRINGASLERQRVNGQYSQENSNCYRCCPFKKVVYAEKDVNG